MNRHAEKLLGWGEEAVGMNVSSLVNEPIDCGFCRLCSFVSYHFFFFCRCRSPIPASTPPICSIFSSRASPRFEKRSPESASGCFLVSSLLLCQIIGKGVRTVLAQRKDTAVVAVDLTVDEVSLGGVRHFVGVMRETSTDHQVVFSFLSLFSCA